MITNVTNTNFRANTTSAQKLLKANLTRDREALIRFTYNNKNEVKGLETIVTSKNRIVDGKAVLAKKALNGEQIADFFEVLLENAKDGKEFVKDFFKAMKS